MDRTSLLSLGIVAGIMTLAYYVGGSKEVRWADTTTPDDGTHPRAEREMIAESFGAEENEMCPSCDKAKIGQDHNRYLVCPLCDWRSDEQVPCRHLNIEITDTDYAGEYEGGVIVYASCEDCGADLQAFGVWEE